MVIHSIWDYRLVLKKHLIDFQLWQKGNRCAGGAGVVKEEKEKPICKKDIRNQFEADLNKEIQYL